MNKRFLAPAFRFSRSRWTLIAGLLLLQACATTPVALPQASSTSVPTLAPPVAAPEAFFLSVGDELEIKFPDRPDLNESAKIRPDGKISMALIGTLMAERKTPEMLEAEITRRYRELAVNASAAGEKKYLISYNDELEIKFPYHENLDQIVRVRPDGRIALSMIGVVVVEGKTPEDLTQELNTRYSKFLRKPDIAIIMRSFSSPRLMVDNLVGQAGLGRIQPVVIVRNFAPLQIFVGGEVQRPGVLAYRNSLTAIQAIIEAGGRKSGATRYSVVILRKTDGVAGPQLLHINVSSEAVASGEGLDSLLQPFDVVVVPKTQLTEVVDFMGQLFDVLPPLKNSLFSFIYDLRR